MPKTFRDSEGNRVRAGDRLTFTYGMPPVRVVASVAYNRDNRLVVLAEGHNPPECYLSDLSEFVGDYYVVHNDHARCGKS